MTNYPKRTGFKLTYDAECMYNDWVDVGGCTCFRCAPCRSCTHEGHYISLEENDEAWEIDEEEEMARDNITDKGSPPKSQWFGYKYRVTPETSKLLQEAVFADGGKWIGSGNKFFDTNATFIFVELNGIMTLSGHLNTFNDSNLPEKEPPQVKLPKVETKALQEEKVSVKSHLHEGNKTFTVTGYDLSVGGDLSITMTKAVKLNNFNQQEGVNMSNVNRVVSVKFFDDDAGLKAEHALVAEYQVTTRVSDAMTVSKVLLTNDVAGDIDLHNKVRSETVDLHILKNTGNKVMLQPVEFEDLRVTVTNI